MRFLRDFIWFIVGLIALFSWSSYADLKNLRRCLAACSENSYRYRVMCRREDCSAVSYSGDRSLCEICTKAFKASADRMKATLNMTDVEIKLIWRLEIDAQSDLRRGRYGRYGQSLRSRRECRDLSQRQRDDLFYAINYLKRNTSSPNVYDTLAKLHQGSQLFFHAHGGSNFLSWHRAYLYYYEVALRWVKRNVALCYWDSRIDFRLNHTQWILTSAFDDALFGNADGEVVTGPFKDWDLPSPNQGLKLARDMRVNISQPMDPKAVNLMLTHPNLRTHTTVTRGGSGHGNVTNSDGRTRSVTIESEHDNVHVFVGGIMSFADFAPLDPVFYFHHCFIDYVWEEFRKKMRSLGEDPENDYPGHGDPSNAGNYTMIGFNWYLNKDGYDDFFTEQVYTYAAPPSCGSCGNSPFMECIAGQCVATKREITRISPAIFGARRKGLARINKFAGRQFTANSNRE